MEMVHFLKGRTESLDLALNKNLKKKSQRVAFSLQRILNRKLIINCYDLGWWKEGVIGSLAGARPPPKFLVY